jgi:HK97 family phage portal protein
VHPLRQWLLKRLAESSEQKAVVSVPVHLSYPAELFFGIADGQQPDTAISARAAFRLFALAYACMQFRATKLAEAPVWIAEESDDGEAMLEGEHPLSDLLEQPNPDMEMADLLEQISLYLDATGATLLVKNRDRGGVTRSLYPYARDEFTVQPANGRLYGEFRVQTGTGYRTLGPDDVLYLRRPSAEHLLSVVAPVDAALSHINIGHAMRTAVKAAMRHAVRPGTIFSAPSNLGPDQFDRLKSEIAETYAGLWNAGKSLLVEGGITAEVQKPFLDDLALGDVNGDVEVAVCQAFQMHPVLVGSRMGIEGSGGFADSMEPALTLFYDLAVYPAWGRIEKAFTRGLLREVDADPRRFIRFDTSRVRALQEDMGEKIEQAAAASAFWTEAEQRAHTGKEGGSDEMPSEKKERQAEEQAALMEAAGASGNGARGNLTLAKSRIVDLTPNGDGWTAKIGSNGNGH